jgi:hypothetical protein
MRGIDRHAARWIRQLGEAVTVIRIIGVSRGLALASTPSSRGSLACMQPCMRSTELFSSISTTTCFMGSVAMTRRYSFPSEWATANFQASRLYSPPRPPAISACFSHAQIQGSARRPTLRSRQLAPEANHRWSVDNVWFRIRKFRAFVPMQNSSTRSGESSTTMLNTSTPTRGSVSD